MSAEIWLNDVLEGKIGIFLHLSSFFRDLKGYKKRRQPVGSRPVILVPEIILQ